MKSPITIFLDASALKNAACGRRLFWDVFTGYREHTTNNDTHWGSAFHKFRAEYKKHNDTMLAIASALKLWKEVDVKIKDNKKYLTDTFLTDACMRYALTYANDYSEPVIDFEDGQPLLEPKSRFAFPFFVKNNIEILIAGTMDDVSYYNSPSYFQGSSGFVVDDCKTAGAFRIYEHLSSYFLDPQLRVYRWAIHKYAQYRPQSIWNTIDKSPNVGCRIDGVYYKAPKTPQDMPSVEFKRSKIMVFKHWELLELERDVIKIADQLISDILTYENTGELPPRSGITTNICTSAKWGPCKYATVCQAVDEEEMRSNLETLFKTQVYNPLNF